MFSKKSLLLLVSFNLVCGKALRVEEKALFDVVVIAQAFIKIPFISRKHFWASLSPPKNFSSPLISRPRAEQEARERVVKRLIRTKIKKFMSVGGGEGRSVKSTHSRSTDTTAWSGGELSTSERS